MNIQRDTWFETIIGIPESEWITDQTRTPKMSSYKSFSQGEFKTISILDLKKAILLSTNKQSSLPLLINCT